MNEILNRIAKLREQMIKDKVTHVYVPTDDYHLSEYVGDYFKCREYISSFTGSAGVCLITLTNAYLWTDSRYFIQAAKELEDTSVELFKMGEEGVLSPRAYLKETLKSGDTLCVDFSVIDVDFGIYLSKLAKTNNFKILNKDYFKHIWTDRPEISRKLGFSLPLSRTGVSRKNKIKSIQEQLIKDNADYTVVASLDDIMWTLNIRGRDVMCSPVMLSYLVIGRDNVTFYSFEESLTNKMKADLKKDGIEHKSYFDIYDDIKNINEKVVVVDKNRVNYAIYTKLQEQNEIIFRDNYSLMMKAIKNKIEIRNMKKAHIKDGVAMVKFLHYVKTTSDEMSELSLGDKIIEFRSEHDTFIEPSFESIVGFKEHGAIVHYSASIESNVKIGSDTFLLVDSGGQYLEGTTDITRTIALGKVTREMKKHFTLALKGHLALYDVKFLKGTSGASLDMLVRKPLWDNGLNYGHGTGHGIGCLLNCHEGPNSISFNRVGVSFVPGMITSNEPGLYIENAYGIGHENLMLCTKVKNAKQPIYRFEQLTYVPFDLNGIDKTLLTVKEKEILNKYHARVYKKISPYLNEKERKWLKQQTRAI